MFIEPYNVLGTVLGIWIILVSEKDKYPLPCITDILGGEKTPLNITHKQIIEDARRQ